eukprot:IDg17863t1
MKLNSQQISNKGLLFLLEREFTVAGSEVYCSECFCALQFAQLRVYVWCPVPRHRRMMSWYLRSIFSGAAQPSLEIPFATASCRFFCKTCSLFAVFSLLSDPDYE